MGGATRLMVQVFLIIVDRWGSKVVLLRASRRRLRRELVSEVCLGRSSCRLLRGIQNKVCLSVLSIGRGIYRWPWELLGLGLRNP